LKKLFYLSENDVVIIGFARTYNDAEKGAITAALTLNDPLRNCGINGPCIVTSDTEADELECLALAIHELTGRMPLTIRSKNKLGLRVEDGEVIDKQYTGPNLEEALVTGKTIRRISSSGPYNGVPLVVVPIMRGKEIIAAIGLVDLTQLTIFDILGRIKKTNNPNSFRR
jgi:hypothetical protein